MRHEWQPGDTVYGLQARNGQWLCADRPFELDGVPAREYRVIDDTQHEATTTAAQAAPSEEDRSE